MRHSILFALAVGLAAPAAANDSIAERPAGGLVLRQTDAIDMLSEDLYLSTAEIRVRYVFRNATPADIRSIVAFPLPDHDLREDFYGDVSYPRDFRTMVDGRPVAMQVEYKALLNGVDHTPLLTGLGVPIMYDNDTIAAIEAALSRLAAAEQQRLLALGLVEPFDDPAADRVITPLWTVRETHFWEQDFPAGRDLVVEHRYRPGAGGTVATGLTDPGFRRGEQMAQMAARYCIDDAFLAGIDRAIRRTGIEGPTFDEQWVSYILTTGANWRSPIGDFRLVVDKGDPRYFVSFCGENVRRIGPTQFEMRRRNWRPERDLNILIIRPLAAMAN